MARPGVTYLEVAEAAFSIQGQGSQPTIELIRRVLGTGSSTTLAKHLRQWKEAQHHNQGLAAKENLPRELLALVKGLWERLFEEAEGKIAQIEASSQAKADALLPELQKYKTNNRRWQQLYHQWMEDRKSLSRDNAELDRQLQQAQQDCAALLEKQEGLKQQLREKQERIQELQRLHQQTQNNLEHFRESTRTQRLMEQQRHEAERKEAQIQVRELKNQQQRLINSFAKLEKQALKAKPGQKKPRLKAVSAL